MKILDDEKISAYTHGALIPVMASGTVLLSILAGKNIYLQIALLIYGFSAVALFTASFVFHATIKDDNIMTFWRKVDRSAIFLLIAGSYTPMCFIYLHGPMLRGILAAQWLLFFSGIFFSFFTNAPRKISTVIYLLMGWLVIIPFKTIFLAMPLNLFSLLVAGGVFYTIGALVYAFKKPQIQSLNMGFHEVFHLFINAGAVTHMLTIIGSVIIFKQTM